MTFVYDFCDRNNLPETPGETQTERECARQASEAREQFKALRSFNEQPAFLPGPSNASSTSPSDDRHKNNLPKDGLSPSQKYSIRIRNNRKSAYASKVFAEVFKRALSKRLHDFSQRCSPPVKDTHSESCLRFAERELRLRQALQSIRREVANERIVLARRKAEGDRMKLALMTICSRMFSVRFGSVGGPDEQRTVSNFQEKQHAFPAGPSDRCPEIECHDQVDRRIGALSLTTQAFGINPQRTPATQNEPGNAPFNTASCSFSDGHDGVERMG